MARVERCECLPPGSIISTEHQQLETAWQKLTCGPLINSLFETDAAILSVHDTEYNVIKVSKAIERLFGSGVVGGKCYRVYQGRDRVCPRCTMPSVIATGQATASQQTGVNGRTYYIWSLPLFDEQRNIIGTLEHSTDITEIKRAENDQRQESRFWNTVFNSANDIISVIHVSDFTIFEANNTFLKAHNLSKDHVIGKTCYQVTHHRSEPCTGPDHICPLTKVVESGQHFITEHVHHNDAGERIFTRVSASPIRNKTGEIVQIVHVSRDITERKETEIRLRASEAKYRSMIETSNEWIWTLDKQGNFVYFNEKAEKASGYNPKEWVGKSFAPIIHPAHLENVRNVFTAVIGGKPMTYEVDVIKADGSVITLFVNSTPIYSNGEITGTLSFGTDITEHKKAERELRKAEDDLRLTRQIGLLKDEFIGMVSHELRNPITVIMGSLDVLGAENITRTQARKLIRNATTGIEDLRTIMDNLLDLVRYQSNSLIIQTQRTEIKPIVKSIVARFQDMSDRHRLVVDIPDGLTAAKIDPVRIERVLFNLMENAIKYSPNGGEVRIFGRQEESRLVLGVSDQGIGIAEEDYSSLFQRFGRLQNQHDISGLGLGLRVCRILVEAHGGRIWVESQPGKGSTFYLTLPLQVD